MLLCVIVLTASYRIVCYHIYVIVSICIVLITSNRILTYWSIIVSITYPYVIVCYRIDNIISHRDISGIMDTITYRYVIVSICYSM
jgi:hypothetical protein